MADVSLPSDHPLPDPPPEFHDYLFRLAQAPVKQAAALADPDQAFDVAAFGSPDAPATLPALSFPLSPAHVVAAMEDTLAHVYCWIRPPIPGCSPRRPYVAVDRRDPVRWWLTFHANLDYPDHAATRYRWVPLYLGHGHLLDLGNGRAQLRLAPNPEPLILGGVERPEGCGVIVGLHAALAEIYGLPGSRAAQRPSPETAPARTDDGNDVVRKRGHDEGGDDPWLNELDENLLDLRLRGIRITGQALAENFGYSSRTDFHNRFLRPRRLSTVDLRLRADALWKSWKAEQKAKKTDSSQDRIRH